MLTSKAEIKNLFSLALWFFIPFGLLVLFGYFLIPSSWDYFRELVGFGLFSGLLFSGVSICKYLPARKIFFLFLLLLLYILVLIKLFFFEQYGCKLSGAALYVIFETNTSEAYGFFTDYVLTSKIVMCLVLFYVFGAWYLFQKRAHIVSKLKQLPFLLFRNVLLKLLVLFFALISLLLLYKKFEHDNILLELYNSYVNYADLQKEMKSSLSLPTSSAFNVIPTTQDSSIHIVIIGESTTRNNMSLYGYDRLTNPMLEALKNELYVFDDVIAPNAQTSRSMLKMLTLQDVLNPSFTPNISVVQLANQAGFETYWLSNQRPLGWHENIPTMMGNAAKHKHFINTNHHGYDVYDENLFEPLEKILIDPFKRKVVFIHLMGTHGVYKRRYPEQYHFFDDIPKGIVLNEQSAIRIRNEYDNAVRYNDFIVRTIIDKVKETNAVSSVVYLSDHGEEVFHTKDYFGHNEPGGTKPMYEIPFIVWLSEANQLNYSIDSTMLKKKYSVENFIHTFADMTNISFDAYDSTKSVVGPFYEENQRFIGIEPRSYD